MICYIWLQLNTSMETSWKCLTPCKVTCQVLEEVSHSLHRHLCLLLVLYFKCILFSYLVKQVKTHVHNFKITVLLGLSQGILYEKHISLFDPLSIS